MVLFLVAEGEMFVGDWQIGRCSTASCALHKQIVLNLNKSKHKRVNAIENRHNIPR